MQSKSLLIAVAAFAVTATGVHAYSGTKLLTRAGLNEDQISAIEEAQELRANGDFVAARDKLFEAGITDDTLRSLHLAAKVAQSVVHKALNSGDYETFKEAVVDSPLSDIITSEEDFEQFRDARELKYRGEIGAADKLFAQLEINHEHKNYNKKELKNGHFGYMSEEFRDALTVAKQANDRVVFQAILDEIGISTPFERHR